MNRKALIYGGVVVLFGVVVLVAVSHNQKNALPPQDLAAVVATTQTPIDQPVPATVLYTSDGFTPRDVHIKKGEAVTIRNTTSQLVHPQADTVATPCDKTTMFDSCDALSPGENYVHTFTEVGVVSYHDVLHPVAVATITVE